jgi:hypothetical protein
MQTMIKHVATEDHISISCTGFSLNPGFDGVRLLLVLGCVAISDRQCVANSDMCK